MTNVMPGNRAYERQEILELFRFTDCLLALPEGLKKRLWNEVKAYEEGEKDALCHQCRKHRHS